VPDGSIDVGSLEGDALTRWYLRSPADIEQERQAAAAKRYQDFYGPSGTDLDPGFAREISGMDHDVDPGFAAPLPPTSHDIDPGFTWVQAGPNRFRSVRLTSDDPSSGPLSLTSMPYGGAASVGDPSTPARSQATSPLEVSGSEPDLTPQPIPQLDGQLIGPPTARFGPPQQAASHGRPQASAFGRAVRAPAGPGAISAVQPGRPPMPAIQPGADRAITYGALRAPAPSDQDLAELRRQQAAFANTTRQIDIHNSWFAVPALAPAVVALGLGAAGEWATGEAAPAVGRAVANFVERDPYLRVGDNWATRAGRRAHAWLEQRAAAKPGWDYEPDVPRPGARPLKPDLGTPPRGPADIAKRYYLELKPNTPTGRAAAARAVKKYFDATGRPVRPIYYDPKDFI
jgi:hypothetical protein